MLATVVEGLVFKVDVEVVLVAVVVGMLAVVVEDLVVEVFVKCSPL